SLNHYVELKFIPAYSAGKVYKERYEEFPKQYPRRQFRRLKEAIVMKCEQETSIMKRTWAVLLLLLLADTPAAVQAQLTIATNGDNTIAFIGYTGAGGVVNIPSTINGLQVTIIGLGAFLEQYGVTGVTIPG